MDIGDWITLSAVIVALGIGTASIIHTNILQRKIRKERLLNEIIEWAKDVAESAISRQTKTRHELRKTELEYKMWRAKGTYITGLIENSSVKNLLPFIKIVDWQLRQAIKITVKQLNTNKKKKTVSTECIKKSENDIKKSVEELFKEAAKIKSVLLK